MIKELRQRWTRPKYRIFLLFLLVSFLAWLVTKLSDQHTDRTSFVLEYINTPDSLVLARASKERVNVRVQASGFQFIGFNFGERVLEVDLSQVQKTGDRFVIPAGVYREQIEKQLSGSMDVISMDADPLYLEFYRVHSKMVPVISRLQVDLSQNHMMDSLYTIRPDSVLVRGPENEIGGIDAIPTTEKKLSEVDQAFDLVLPLSFPDSLEHTSFSVSEVRVMGEVYRFSEKIIEVPVQVVNLPEDVAVKTFPAVVKVICKGRIEALKNLSASDFTVVADYREAKDQQDFLPLMLKEKPENLHLVELEQEQVEFILKRE